MNKVVAVDSTVPPEQDVNNHFEHRLLKYHVPDFYYTIYYSNDSDDVKLEKLKQQNWVT